MAHFVVDEAGWRLEGIEPDEISTILHSFAARLDVIESRNEEAKTSREIYEFNVTTEYSVYQLLFENTPLMSDHDFKQRLQRSLDRLPYWDEDIDPPAYDVLVEGTEILAPSIAYAHEQTGAGTAVACLPLSSAGRRGPVSVKVSEAELSIHFVTDEHEHRSFFRNAVEIEDVDRHRFEALASSAFPDLVWADNIWGGLNSFSKPFRDIRSDVVTHLAVLDDHGAQVFIQNLGQHPNQIGPRLSASGAEASDENGRTKANAEARRSRTRTYMGTEHVFWWHTKLQPHEDRIHFLFDSVANHIVIGIFTKHCYLP